MTRLLASRQSPDHPVRPEGAGCPCLVLCCLPSAWSIAGPPWIPAIFSSPPLACSAPVTLVIQNRMKWSSRMECFRPDVSAKDTESRVRSGKCRVGCGWGRTLGPCPFPARPDHAGPGHPEQDAARLSVPGGQILSGPTELDTLTQTFQY